jgi:cytoskeletal protein RodZ
MSRKQIIIGSITLAVVAIVAIALLLAGNSPSQDSNGAANPPGSTSATSTSASTTTSASANASSTTKPGGTATSTASTSDGSNGTVSDTNPALSPLIPYPKLPDPGLPARTMTSPAANGAKLAPVAEAPDPTISGLKLGQVPDGSRYQITMRPYGIGPSIALGSRLVIRVTSAKPMAPAPKLDVIANANVLALVDTTHGGKVTTGGTYTAYLTFRSDETKLLPIISNVALAK